MKHIVYYFMLVGLAISLTACVPTRDNIFPPTISIQQLNLQKDGQWQLTLRIQNNSYASMDFQTIVGALNIGQGVPVRISAHFKRDIPPLAADVIRLVILPTPAMSQALAELAYKGSAGSLLYRLDGISTAKPAHDTQVNKFTFQYHDWLSPVPGIPNIYR